MYRLSSIIGFLGLAFSVMAQSPHGEEFKMNCAACHTSDSWEISIDNFTHIKLVFDIVTTKSYLGHVGKTLTFNLFKIFLDLDS